MLEVLLHLTNLLAYIIYIYKQSFTIWAERSYIDADYLQTIQIVQPSKSPHFDQMIRITNFSLLR